MEPKESRPRSPSLLDGDGPVAAPAIAAERATPSLQHALPATRPRRFWRWPLGLLLLAVAAVLLLGLGGAFDAGKAPATKRTAIAGSAVQPATGQAVAMDSAPPQAAVILPSEPSAPLQPAVAPTPAASVNPEAEVLSEMLAPSAGRKPAHAAPASPARPRPEAASGSDSDVTLLSALINHVEVESASARKARVKVERASPAADSIEARMQACPAANTEAGLRCREKICNGHAGDAACPTSVGGA